MGSSKLCKSMLWCKGRPISADVGFCGVLSPGIRPSTKIHRVAHIFDVKVARSGESAATFHHLVREILLIFALQLRGKAHLGFFEVLSYKSALQIRTPRMMQEEARRA